MFQVAIGQSEDPFTEDAVRDVINQCEGYARKFDLIGGIVYASMEYDFEVIARLLGEKYPKTPFIGGSVTGGFTNQRGVLEDCVQLMLFFSDTILIKGGLGGKVKESPLESAKEALSQASEGMDGAPVLCFMFPEGLHNNADMLIRGIQDVIGANVPIIGGIASDNFEMSRSFQVFGGKVYQNSLPLLLFFGPLQMSVGVGYGWTPYTGEEIITRAEEQTIYQIGEHTTQEYYKRFCGISEGAGDFMLAIFDSPDRPDYYCRCPMRSDPKKQSMSFSSKIQEGKKVMLAKASQQSILEATATAVQKAIEQLPPQVIPAAALVVSCSACQLRLGTSIQEQVSSIRHKIAQETPIFGIYSFGEIGPLKLGEPSIFHNGASIILVLGNS